MNAGHSKWRRPQTQLLLLLDREALGRIDRTTAMVARGCGGAIGAVGTRQEGADRGERDRRRRAFAGHARPDRACRRRADALEEGRQLCGRQRPGRGRQGVAHHRRPSRRSAEPTPDGERVRHRARRWGRPAGGVGHGVRIAPVRAARGRISPRDGRKSAGCDARHGTRVRRREPPLPVARPMNSSGNAKILATTYFPERLPSQYLRRWRA